MLAQQVLFATQRPSAAGVSSGTNAALFRPRVRRGHAKLFAGARPAVFASAQPPSSETLKELGKSVAGELDSTSIFLVGMMGSGKTTVGKIIASNLGYVFVDTDQVIEGVLKKPISQIFEEDGAQGFREAETSVLNEVASYARFVVSTGGGIVASKENWGHLHNGIVVYLETPVEVLAARVARDGVAKRPLLKGAPAGQEHAYALEKLQEIFAERKRMYEQADVTVAQGGEGEGAAMQAEDGVVVAERVLRALERRLKESDTKQRLRNAPEPGSVSITGGKGPLKI